MVNAAFPLFGLAQAAAFGVLHAPDVLPVAHGHDAPFVAVETTQEEPLVMFYAIELLRTLENLHGCGIVHGDLGPSNIHLRNDPCGEWDTLWRPDGQGGWAGRGILVGGFDGAVDLHVIPEGKQLTATAERAPFCHAMGLSAWKHQADYHAIVDCIHQLLHNAPMEIHRSAGGSWEPVAPLRWARHPALVAAVVDGPCAREQTEVDGCCPHSPKA